MHLFILHFQAKKEENIYLGRFKQKLKEAVLRFSGAGRENKVENLRELVGGGKTSLNMSKGTTPRGWLDPHCHELQFERWNPP